VGEGATLCCGLAGVVLLVANTATCLGAAPLPQKSLARPPSTTPRKQVSARSGSMASGSGKSTNKVRPIIVQGHERPLTMVKYNREGDLLFTAAKDYRPCMWYADNGERIGTFEGHTGTVWCVDVNCARRRAPSPLHSL
jgi:WD40 repeat protein